MTLREIINRTCFAIFNCSVVDWKNSLEMKNDTEFLTKSWNCPIHHEIKYSSIPDTDFHKELARQFNLTER